jgi:hypothetical protein
MEQRTSPVWIKNLCDCPYAWKERSDLKKRRRNKHVTGGRRDEHVKRTSAQKPFLIEATGPNVSPFEPGASQLQPLHKPWPAPRRKFLVAYRLWESSTAF